MRRRGLWRPFAIHLSISLRQWNAIFEPFLYALINEPMPLSQSLKFKFVSLLNVDWNELIEI